MDDTTTQLLTLLNVSALKRNRPVTESPRLKKKPRSVVLSGADDAVSGEESVVQGVEQSEGTEEEREGEEEEEEEEGGMHSDGSAPENDADNQGDQTSYGMHFGPGTPLLTESAREGADHGRWTKKTAKHGQLGAVSVFTLEGGEPSVAADSQAQITPKLRSAYDDRGAKLPSNQNQFRSDVLTALAGYRDVLITRTELDQQSIARDAITLHALNHIFNIRRRVLKNNDRLSRAQAKQTEPSASAPPTTPSTDVPALHVQDQGFTRPSVLVLLPFRSSAVRWAEAFFAHLPAAHQVEHRARFLAEYGLPPGAVDKLALDADGPGPERGAAARYPRDHVEMFAGNVDDNFRVGVKVTKKSVKMFAEFYRCDLILASPLGLRMSIEKEKSSDFLSSIEVLIIDQMDALAMQNWEHLQFVLGRLNQLPKEAHDADFSRIKPWYLDNQAVYLRQSILLSPYETPEIRALFCRTLKNVAGKVRTERRWRPVPVPEGVEQKYEKFECLSPKSEPDKRFELLTTQVLPSILKSAVQSTNTLIFVPSSFDFIRVQNYFRRRSDDASLAVLSEYSSNPDISRARQAFFSGKKRFLLMSERFHFFRRYRIRGVRNIVFFGIPAHPQFYTELLSYPFLDDGVAASDVTCRVLYCKYDAMALERIVGSESVGRLIR